MIETYKSKIVPIRYEPPDSIYFQRPSIEYTGHGNDIVLDGWGGRWFCASEEWVRKGCQEICSLYNNGSRVNYNDLYVRWNIETTDFGSISVYDPISDTTRAPKFTYSWCGPGSRLYDKFNRRVLLVEPEYDAFPEYINMEA